MPKSKSAYSVPTKKQKPDTYIFVVWVDNESGVLARGALVASVADNSPSDKAGIKSGDIILEFNGEKINQMKELPAIVARTRVGKNVIVKIWRDKKGVRNLNANSCRQSITH